MEDIIEIGILTGGIIFTIVIQMIRRKNVRREGVPGKGLADPFPSLETDDEDESLLLQEEAERKRMHVSSVPRVCTARPVVHSSSVPPRLVAPRDAVRLSTREEARRAFLAAEIFTRKYQ